MPTNKNQLHQTNWRVLLRGAEVVPGFASLRNITCETVLTTEYNFVGRNRRSAGNSGFFQYTLSGSGVFWDRQGEHRIGPGTGFMCVSHDPDTGYRYPASATEPWTFFHCSMVGAGELVQSLNRRYGYVFEMPLDSSPIHRIYSWRRYADSEVEIPAGESHMLVMRFLAGFVDAAGGPGRSRQSELAYQARQTIKSHIHEPLSVAGLATILQVSPEHLCRVVKRETGQTPIDLIRQEKMAHACELLKATRMSIKEVYQGIGFVHASHFARAFRAVVGQSPREFRSQEGLRL